MARILRFLKYLSKITVEPIMFMYIFAQNMSTVTIVTLLMERSCRITHGHSIDHCKRLLDDPSLRDIKLEVQKSANDWILINNFVIMFPAMVLAVFYGSWSDKYGRKPIIIIPLIGDVLYATGLVAMAYYTTWPPYVITLVALPNALLGGYIHMMPLMSYISDISNQEQRSAKFFFVEGLCFLAYPLGTLAGGYIYNCFGFVCVFSCSAVIYSLAVLYTVICVKETKGTECQLTKLQLIREFFRLKHAKECISVFTRPRTSNGRLDLFLLITTLAIYGAEIDSSIMYMYTQLVFDWDEVKYSVFRSATFFAGVSFNTIAGPILTYVIGINDAVLGVISSITQVMFMVVMSLARTSLVFYIGGMIGLFNRMIPPVARSSMTKIVGPEDNGKLFAIVSSVGSLSPIVGNLINSRLYNATADFFPSATLLYSGFIALFSLCAYLYMLPIKKKDCEHSQTLVS